MHPLTCVKYGAAALRGATSEYRICVSIIISAYGFVPVSIIICVSIIISAYGFVPVSIIISAYGVLGQKLLG